MTMEFNQAEDFLSHPQVPSGHAIALGSSARNTDSIPRSVTYIIQSATSEELLHRTRSVSVDEPPHNADVADTAQSPSASYTHSPLQPIGRDPAPFQTDPRNDLFTGFHDSVILGPPYASRLSIDTIQSAESDIDLTAVSASAQGAGEFDDDDTAPGAQSDARPDYGNALVRMTFTESDES
jgi:hypothetical protein